MAKLITPASFLGGNEIASNSLAIAFGDLVSKSSGFLVKAGTTGEIEGMSTETKTFAADNQTVKKAKLEYVKLDADTILELTADASISQADVGSYFNINADGTVDVATKSVNKSVVNTSDAGSATDAVVTKQLKLVKVVNSTLGNFVKA